MRDDKDYIMKNRVILLELFIIVVFQLLIIKMLLIIKIFLNIF